MMVEQVLNYILWGADEVFKSLEFNLQSPCK